MKKPRQSLQFMVSDRTVMTSRVLLVLICHQFIHVETSSINCGNSMPKKVLEFKRHHYENLDETRGRISVNSNLIGQTFTSFSFCLRFTMSLSLVMFPISDMAGVSLLIENPRRGTSFIKIRGNNDEDFWYMAFLSENELPIQTYISLCLSLSNSIDKDNQPMTSLKLYNNGNLCADNLYLDNEALDRNFTFGSYIEIGRGEDNGFKVGFMGLITDVNIWTRTLTDREMIDFTTKASDLTFRNREDYPVFAWDSVQFPPAMESSLLKHMAFDEVTNECSPVYLWSTDTLQYRRAREYCHLIGGSMDVGWDKADFKEVIKNIESTKYRVGNGPSTDTIWVPIIQDISQQVGIYRHFLLIQNFQDQII